MKYRTASFNELNGSVMVAIAGPGIPNTALSVASQDDVNLILGMLNAAFEAGKRVRSGEILTLLKGDVAGGMK